MRIFLGMLGAMLGALAAFYFVGPFVASYVTSVTDFQSPDQAGEAHAFTFGGSILVLLVLGWVLGWFIGRRIDRYDDVESI